MQGIVFSIEEFSVYDGPGIRTSVFLKGCPLRCSWCHNPEGQSRDIQIVRSPNGCISCGTCTSTAVTVDGQLCFTQESIDRCPMNLLRYCGEEISSDALCQTLLKNQRILSNGGGVTFSGGEPLMQSDFLFSCLRSLKGKLHTAIQTSGFCSTEVFREALSLADYFLYDLKLTDSKLHQKFTGVTNEPILQNFALLAESGKNFTIRVPLIPGVTDTSENLTAIAQLLDRHHIHYIELLPYNKMAGGKYAMLLRTYDPGFDVQAEPQPHTGIFQSFGITAKIL